MSTSFKEYVPKEYPIGKWWPNYSKALFILARTYDPENMDNKISKLEGQQMMYNFITSLIQMMPNQHVSKYCVDFLYMKEYVANNLVNRLPKFFYAFPQYYDMITLQGGNFFNTCLNSGVALFNWIYLLQSFIYMKAQDNGMDIMIPTLNDVRETYHIDKLTIEDWGNTIWFILHTCALYAPEPMTQSFYNYRMILESLQYLLPCPKCRVHLRQNLQRINLTTCAQTRTALFTCSWELHNIVNEATKKPQMSLQDAVKLYI